MAKDEGEFHKNAAQPDGLQTHCKPCRKEYQSRWDKTEKGKQVYRRYRQSSSAKAIREEYFSSDHGKSVKRRLTKKYREEHPEKYAAHNAVAVAVRSSVLMKSPCEACGSEVRVEAHHDDYSKPLDVRWLCHMCHTRIHRMEGAA